jgi:hypothetical protein
MTVAAIFSTRSPAPRRPRLDAVLGFHHRHDHTGVRVGCDVPFVMVDATLEIAFTVWRGWQRVRLHVRPAGSVPRTMILLDDLHGNPLSDGRNSAVRSIDSLDVDLVPHHAAGMGLSLVFAGPGNITTVRVLLAGPLARPGRVGPTPPPQRVLAVSRPPTSGPHVSASRRVTPAAASTSRPTAA